MTYASDSGDILLPALFIKVNGQKSRRFIRDHDIGSDHVSAVFIVALQVIEDDTIVYGDKALVGASRAFMAHP